MIRKTFTTEEKAQQYKKEIIANEGMSVIGNLGDKFRVYAESKEEMERLKSFRSNWTPDRTLRFLRETAWKAKEAIDDAITLKKSMESGDIYNDYETSIEAARILEKEGELKSARDVFAFIDDTSKYDTIMKQLIENSFEDYDYEAKEEVARD